MPPMTFPPLLFAPLISDKWRRSRRYPDEAFSPSHYVCHRGHFHVEKSETINDTGPLNNCEGIIFGKLH